MATININGISISGNSIQIKNGQVTIDGKAIVVPESKQINIKVEGDISSINADFCEKIIANGNVGLIKTQSGNVDIAGHVDGSVSTMSGNIDCGDVEGDVQTMSGNIKYTN